MLFPFPEERPSVTAAQPQSHRLPCGKGTFTQSYHPVVRSPWLPPPETQAGRSPVTLHLLNALLYAQPSSPSVKDLSFGVWVWGFFKFHLILLKSN